MNPMSLKRQKLSIDFYTGELLIVAQQLLGKMFVFNNKNLGRKLSAKIVEVEAYNGNIDEAAHTFNGKTERNKIMFERGGYLYVYFTYGKHFCANIVTGKEEEGTAILLRGMEAIDGIESFSQNRFGKTSVDNKEKKNLLNGPGKICQAFGISKEQYGMDLLSDEIYLLDAPRIPKNKIVQTTRIGIKKSEELPWRFYIEDNSNVSRK